MTLEEYTTYCVMLLTFGFGAILWSLSSRLGRLEKKLNMEDEYEDPVFDDDAEPTS